MTKYIILTNKGYICEKNAVGEYENKSNDFYFNAKGINGFISRFGGVYKLGFTGNKEDATRYSANIGNSVQEITDRIEFGYEDINEIKIIVEEVGK